MSTETYILWHSHTSNIFNHMHETYTEDQAYMKVQSIDLNIRRKTSLKFFKHNRFLDFLMLQANKTPPTLAQGQ